MTSLSDVDTRGYQIEYSIKMKYYIKACSNQYNDSCNEAVVHDYVICNGFLK